MMQVVGTVVATGCGAPRHAGILVPPRGIPSSRFVLTHRLERSRMGRAREKKGR